jgi:PAS domain-containing protein
LIAGQFIRPERIMDAAWQWVVVTALIAVLATTAALIALSAVRGRTDPGRKGIFADHQAGTVFLFDGEDLVDATPAGRSILSRVGFDGAAWGGLMVFLAGLFPGVESRLATLREEGEILIPARDNGASALALRAEWRGGLTRISLFNPDETGATDQLDPLTVAAMEAEIARLRQTLKQAPFPIWREDGDGRIIWANGAYLLKIAEGESPDLTWPLPRLLDAGDAESKAVSRRARLHRPGMTPLWFDVLEAEDNGDTIAYALPADAAVRAETAQKEFTQTLTKTFANLPIGLAIFDKQRQLALFNPALMDFSGLPPDFLSIQPTLFAFLDAMRERSMIPEPKDYRSWRKQMTDLEQAASSGLFEDIWTLPNGQTYRIIGRPHPNGALALMFEDISPEVARTRRFRANLEISQSVIDTLSDAIAVFSESGQLVMANAAYSTLWGDEALGPLNAGSIAAICAGWKERSAPDDIWSRIESFVVDPAGRQGWESSVRLTDGRLLTCRTRALTGGATLISFAPAPAQDADLPFRREPKQKSA